MLECTPGHADGRLLILAKGNQRIFLMRGAGNPERSRPVSVRFSDSLCETGLSRPRHNAKALAGSQGLETISKGHLRRCRRDFMQFSRVLLLVLRKYDVDLRVCRNGDNDTAIGIEVHDLRIAGRPDILS
jgi:hypothetical protein